MRKNMLFGVLSIFMVLLVGYFVFSQSVSATINKNVNIGEAQVVKLSVQGGNYVLVPSEVKKGVPVRIEGDISKMPGCSKSIVIPTFDVRKNLDENDNAIEFTPNKAGTFNIACSMNMYRGTFIVLEDDGSKPAYVDQALPQGSSCGAGGGCGCGGGAI